MFVTVILLTAAYNSQLLRRVTAFSHAMNWKGREGKTPWKNTRKISFADFETGTF